MDRRLILVVHRGRLKHLNYAPDRSYRLPALLAAEDGQAVRPLRDFDGVGAAFVAGELRRQGVGSQGTPSFLVPLPKTYPLNAGSEVVSHGVV